MNKVFNLLLLGCLMVCISSCGTNSQSDHQDPADNATEIKWDKTDVAAVAFIGYFSDTDKALEKASALYGVDARWVEMEGDECYLIVPRTPEATIQVSEYSYDIVTDTEIIGDELYQGDEAPVLVRCNISDITANCRITITHEGTKAVFIPQLNLMDGTINIPGQTPADEGTVCDITIYDKHSDNEIVDNTVAYDSDPFGNIRPQARIINGKVQVIVDNDSEPHNVEGLNGSCKKLFFGNWGQDVNPLLCMLMEDGSVEILDFNNAVSRDDFLSSGNIPGLEDIVSFNQYGDEGGSIVQAVDKDGKAHDIEMFLGCPSEIYHFEKTDRGTMRYSLYLSADWKMYFGRGICNSEYEECYVGRFSGKSFLGENEAATYQYRTIQALVADPDSESGTSMTKVSDVGTFSLKHIEISGEGIDYEVQSKSGVIKFCDTYDSIYGYSDISPFSYKAE
ncbi:MAG: hypothetical protein PHD11_07925 [Bacteroidales bacterium]|nr:hypothetical protein [Bacteroidales bacterium]MDD4671106.1 hypothetical protein [Bacteroidales bacterium]